MGLKRLLLVSVGSLGLITWVGPAGGALTLAGDDEPATSKVGDTDDERRRALELLRQATAELNVNRLDAARRLAKQAADLNATYSWFDVRPELVIGEIDLKERIGGGLPAAGVRTVQEPAQSRNATGALDDAAAERTDPVESPKSGGLVTASNASAPPGRPLPITQAAAEQQPRGLPSENPPSPDQLKARAIEILDRGLQALDEQRLDDAERDARAALTLHASFSKLEYKPEYLITEVGIARARLRLDAATSPSPQSRWLATSTSPMTHPKPPAIPDPQFPQDASLVVNRPLQPAALVPAPAAVSAPATPVAQPYSAAQAAASVPGATSSRERAERLVQDALTNLHAGRDDAARSRMAAALGVIHAGVAGPLPQSSPAKSPTVASPQPTLHRDLPRPTMPGTIHPLTVADTENQPAKARWPEGQPPPTWQSAAAPGAPTLTVQPDTLLPYPGELPLYSLDCPHVACAPSTTDCWVPRTTCCCKLCPCYFRGIWNGLIGE